MSAIVSAQESFGLAALEAMTCEVPVVASNVGGLPEVIDHGVTGFLHAPDDLDGMAASVGCLLTRRCGGNLAPPLNALPTFAIATRRSSRYTRRTITKRWPRLPLVG